MAMFIRTVATKMMATDMQRQIESFYPLHMCRLSHYCSTLCNNYYGAYVHVHVCTIRLFDIYPSEENSSCLDLKKRE